MRKIIPTLIEKGVNIRWNNGLSYQREIRHKPLDKIKEIQWKRLRNLLDYVYENNRYYKHYFDSVKLTPTDIQQPKDLLKLPTTEKRTYRSHFKDMLSEGVNSDRHILSCTSGSSGEPFKFYNQWEMVKKTLYFSYILNKESMGIQPYEKLNELEIKPNPRNEVNIDTLEIPNKKVIEKIKDLFFTEIIGLRCDDVFPKNIESIVNIIHKYNIKGIYGYSTSLLELANQLRKKNHHIRLHYIICIGEGLLKQQKQFISDTFHCPVFMDYGASECPRMGFECTKNNGYHMDIYNYFFEYIKDGMHVKGNESAEIIVTNLNNYIFPFIRYRIGDIAELTSQQCDCDINLPIIKNIHGRIHSSIITPHGKEIPNGFFSVYLEYYYESIYQYQVIQTKKDEITLKLVPAKKIEKETLDKIKKWVMDLCENTMNVKIVLTDEILPGKNGKKLDLISYEQYKKMKDNHDKSVEVNE